MIARKETQHVLSGSLTRSHLFNLFLDNKCDLLLCKELRLHAHSTTKDDPGEVGEVGVWRPLNEHGEITVRSLSSRMFSLRRTQNVWKLRFSRGGPAEWSPSLRCSSDRRLVLTLPKRNMHIKSHQVTSNMEAYNAV